MHKYVVMIKLNNEWGKLSSRTFTEEEVRSVANKLSTAGYEIEIDYADKPPWFNCGSGLKDALRGGLGPKIENGWCKGIQDPERTTKENTGYSGNSMPLYQECESCPAIMPESLEVHHIVMDDIKKEAGQIMSNR